MIPNNLAFIFPGQGSQKVKMLADVAVVHSEVEGTFAQASEVLGYDLWQLVQEGPQAALNLTERTQPMLLTASVALWRVWRKLAGTKPGMMAGHSLGEWSALVCAGVIEFQDAVSLVQLRGKYMQEAVPADEGAMAAIIGLEDEVVAKICRQVAEQEVVSVANFNAPGQVVIAGDIAAVDRACALCKDQGAKRAMPLAVSAPFHSTLMRPAADRFAKVLESVAFIAPKIAVVHNVHAKVEQDPAVIKQCMVEQIYRPVLWVDCVKMLAANGMTTLVECGPGKVLSGLVKRIDRGLQCWATEKPNEVTAALAAVKASN